jgi:crotonobetainyl-CoA:carnitine CoA-transferase CaiB-like acyl-CoA transferase
MHKPLEGIRILEWGIFYAGPGASAILSDMGAEVIKLEQRGEGDPFRQADLTGLEVSGDSEILFQGANRGKKSITLDLAQAAGRQVAYDLVNKSDIFFTNVRSETIQKLQMDYPTLSRINPRIIYARITAYGTRGPDADRGGFDPHGQARSGMMYALGEDEPVFARFGIIDHSTAIMASYQMVIALLMRERFGVSQEVEVSLLGTAAYLMYIGNLPALLGKRDYVEYKHIGPLRNKYRCLDGKWLMIRMRDKDWLTLCRFLGCGELEHDSRFDTPEKRMINSEHLVSIFEKAFATRERDQWLRIFSDKSLMICAVNTQLESFNDPQMIENGYIINTQHPDLGPVRVPGFPIHFSQAEVNSSIAAPRLGEHTSEVLHDLLGYSEERIATLRARGVV